ncbi:MAG: hypothetical protein KA763_00485 [Xanthomonadales bacterium]|nr:hypothetical protein [Xanthomonadales bacterium]
MTTKKPFDAIAYLRKTRNKYDRGDYKSADWRAADDPARWRVWVGRAVILAALAAYGFGCWVLIESMVPV